jgi:hypothetical protein
MSKIIIPQETAEVLAEKFRSGCSITELEREFEYTRKPITRSLKETLGDQYEKFAKLIIASRSAKFAHKRVGKKIKRTPEWNKKIGDAHRGRKLSDERRKQIGESWKQYRAKMTIEEKKALYEKIVTVKRNSGALKMQGKKHSAWMTANAPMCGKKVSEETKQKMREAKRRYFENGGIPSQFGKTRSPEQRKATSEQTKRMWKEGKFSYGDGSVMRSKLEKDVYARIQSIFPDAEHSRWLTVDDITYVFDVYIPSIKTFVEINGDYWHLNPKLYEATHYDKYRKVTAQDVWNKDANKRRAAEECGLKLITIWESDASTFEPTSLL